MLTTGDIYTDQRGTMQFVNGFNFDSIKRFYTITHPDTSIIRAWQGHKIETKHFFVTKGTFLICWVTIDNWDFPSKELKVNRQILKEKTPQVLTIAPGNANGLKAMEPGSQIIIFSDLTFE
jgi:dTDP-4-dehydrorhamnose 3,5-epimerase-like enzyme